MNTKTQTKINIVAWYILSWISLVAIVATTAALVNHYITGTPLEHPNVPDMSSAAFWIVDIVFCGLHFISRKALKILKETN